MNYHKISKLDMLNGEGLRVVLWVSGCSHHCKGCHNPQTWDINSGVKFDDNAMQTILEYLDNDYIKGITFTGGDPLNENNRQTIKEISEIIKDKFPNKDQWLYTGYTYEEIISSEELNKCIENIDILVDGKFEIDKKDEALEWAGSSNQNIIRLSSN